MLTLAADMLADLGRLLEPGRQPDQYHTSTSPDWPSPTYDEERRAELIARTGGHAERFAELPSIAPQPR